MTPSEMEEQIRNLNERAFEVAQILPKLATKEDLQVFATKEDLKAFATKEEVAQAINRAIAPLARKEDVEASKRYTENLILVTRQEIRRVDDKVTSIADDVKKIAEQVAILTTRRRKL